MTHQLNNIQNMSAINMNDTTSTFILNNDSRIVPSSFMMNNDPKKNSQVMVTENDHIDRVQMSYILRNDDLIMHTSTQIPQQNNVIDTNNIVNNNSNNAISRIDFNKIYRQIDDSVCNQIDNLHDKLIQPIMEQECRLSGMKLRLSALKQKYRKLDIKKQKQMDIKVYNENSQQTQFNYKQKYELLNIEIQTYNNRIKELEQQVAEQQQSESQNEQQQQQQQTNNQSNNSLQYEYEQMKEQNMVDQKVIQQLWETVNEKNQEIERQKQMIDDLKGSQNQNSNLQNIEVDFEDIYEKLKLLTDNQ